jgi:Sigma-70 region 2
MHLTTTNASGTRAARRGPSRGRCDSQRLGRTCSSGDAPVGEACLGHKRRRPTRGDIDRVAVDLIQRRGREILATARRYASNLDDAEDAYQRGLEILLRKAPTTREVELVRWLKTVVLRTIDPSPRETRLTRWEGLPVDGPDGRATLFEPGLVHQAAQASAVGAHHVEVDVADEGDPLAVR